MYLAWFWERTAITETEFVYCAVWAESLTMIQVNRNLPKINSLSEIDENWIENYCGFVADFSKWRPGFDPENLPVGFVVKNVVLRHVVLRHVFNKVFRFSPVGIIPPTLRTRLHLPVALIRKTNRQSLGTFRESNTTLEIGLQQKEKYFHLVLYG